MKEAFASSSYSPVGYKGAGSGPDTREGKYRGIVTSGLTSERQELTRVRLARLESEEEAGRDGGNFRLSKGRMSVSKSPANLALPIPTDIRYVTK